MARSKVRRSTVSLEMTTIELARRLCRAWEEHSGRLPTINEVVLDGLNLVVGDYQRKKIRIPKKAAAMRPGPKEREE